MSRCLGSARVKKAMMTTMVCFLECLGCLGWICGDRIIITHHVHLSRYKSSWLSKIGHTSWGYIQRITNMHVLIIDTQVNLDSQDIRLIFPDFLHLWRKMKREKSKTQPFVGVEPLGWDCRMFYVLFFCFVFPVCPLLFCCVISWAAGPGTCRGAARG
jgi:hypothetical protein